MKRAIAAWFVALFMPLNAVAQEGPPLRDIEVDITDKPALQRGAKYFVNYCMGCHSAKYVRYSQVAEGLGIGPELTERNLILTDAKFFDPMAIAVPPKDAERWFGVPPPDLTETAHVRGEDWLYTYLTTFYRDESRPFGVNNLVFPDVAMPHVLWKLQGLQAPVMEEAAGPDGEKRRVITGLRLEHPGDMTPEEYDRAVRDVVTFLVYISRPYAMTSQRIGIGVVAVLLLFTVLAWLLKREYWREVE